MNTLLWIAQVLLAGTFFFTATTKLLAYEKVVKVVEATKGNVITMTRSQAILVAFAEIIGGLGILCPNELAPPHLAVRAAAAWLALLMVGAGIYHLRRNESAAPNVALILLSIFVIVGRWPR